MSDAQPPADRTPSLDPLPQAVAEIDRLAEVARRAPGDTEAMGALWDALYGLDRWLFIARGEAERPSPYTIVRPEGPMLLAFTTAERARTGGMGNGLGEEETRRLLAVPLPGGIEWAASLEGHGVRGLIVDDGTLGAFAPLGNLVPMRDWFAQRRSTGGS